MTKKKALTPNKDLAEAVVENEIEYTLPIFSNVVDDQMATSMLMMFVEGVYKNQVGIMRALDIATGDTKLLLVGVEVKDDGSSVTYPLAYIMTPQEATFFHSPDGKGNYDPGTFTPGMPVAA